MILHFSRCFFFSPLHINRHLLHIFNIKISSKHLKISALNEWKQFCDLFPQASTENWKPHNSLFIIIMTEQQRQLYKQHFFKALSSKSQLFVLALVPGFTLKREDAVVISIYSTLESTLKVLVHTSSHYSYHKMCFCALYSIGGTWTMKYCIRGYVPQNYSIQRHTV